MVGVDWGKIVNAVCFQIYVYANKLLNWTETNLKKKYTYLNIRRMNRIWVDMAVLFEHIIVLLLLKFFFGIQIRGAF